MIDLRADEIVIVENLKKYLNSGYRECEVIRQNQVAQLPPYDYVSYTRTTPVSAHGGTYSETEDGTLYKNVTQTWSFTTHSDDQDRAMTLALQIYDFFSAVGLTLLADNNIAVRQVRGVTTRDTLITIEYEYRNGLDVTFGLMYEITPPNGEVIETTQVGERVIGSAN